MAKDDEVILAKPGFSLVRDPASTNKRLGAALFRSNCISEANIQYSVD